MPQLKLQIHWYQWLPVDNEEQPQQFKQIVNKIFIILFFNYFALLLKNVINASNQTITPPGTALPILSLADYTTSRGVPTAAALANQAKITTRKTG